MRRRRSRRPSGWYSVAALAVVGGAVFLSDGGATRYFGGMSLSTPLANWSCNIKGNISQNTGERIYHVPGQRYYERTVISVDYGEQWFCSEADARKAGWRRSRV